MKKGNALVQIQTLGSYDPTHTTVLRDQFATEMRKRFRIIRGAIRAAIVDKDCFGLKNSVFTNPLTLASYASAKLPGAQAFDFVRSSDKVEAFMEWLTEQTDNIILEAVQLGTGVEDAWTNTYIQSAYQRGMVRARNELRGAGYLSKVGEEIPELETEGMISALFNGPMHADRAGLIYSRVYQDLKGITTAMGTQISRVLSQGMLDGMGPLELAKILTKTISGPMGDLGITDTLGRFIPAERRAVILARTEIIRAHHLATVQEYRNWGLAGVKVKAEWQTAGDGRVCEQCAELQGKVYTLDEIEKKLPRHPQCRCVALPVDMTDEEEKTPSTVRKIMEKEPTVEWKPVMDESTSEKWSAGSAFTQMLYHGSRFKENISGILQDGFKVADGNLGVGAYLTTDSEFASAYATHGEVLATRVKLNNPIMGKRGKVGGILADFEDEYIDKLKISPEEFDPFAFNKWLQEEKNIDGLVAHRLDGSTWVVVFDKKNVVVVK